ncbi:hypothetical protein KRMM14A1259_08410 [Krasilnikovia sp. MM14-A1259]
MQQSVAVGCGRVADVKHSSSKLKDGSSRPIASTPRGTHPRRTSPQVGSPRAAPKGSQPSEPRRRRGVRHIKPDPGAAAPGCGYTARPSLSGRDGAGADGGQAKSPWVVGVVPILVWPGVRAGARPHTL